MPFTAFRTVCGLLSLLALQAPKEWYFYPDGYHPEHTSKASTAAGAGAAAAAPAVPSLSYTVGDETVPGPDETGRAGPMSKDALRQLHTKGVITSSSWVWAGGMPAPQQLGRVRELRWMLSSGLGLLGPFDATLVALQVREGAKGGPQKLPEALRLEGRATAVSSSSWGCGDSAESDDMPCVRVSSCPAQVLQQLASLQPAVDEEGLVLQPLPRAHRRIADPTCLPHIAQVMLTGEGPATFKLLLPVRPSVKHTACRACWPLFTWQAFRLFNPTGSALPEPACWSTRAELWCAVAMHVLQASLRWCRPLQSC